MEEIVDNTYFSEQSFIETVPDDMIAELLTVIRTTADLRKNDLQTRHPQNQDPGIHLTYSKNCVKRPLSKRPKKMVCRMLQRENSALLLTFIQLPVVIKTFVLFIFEGPFYTDFTVSEHKLRCAQPVKIENYI